jgi:hypothetical protein
VRGIQIFQFPAEQRFGFRKEDINRYLPEQLVLFATSKKVATRHGIIDNEHGKHEYKSVVGGDAEQRIQDSV